MSLFQPRAIWFVLFPVGYLALFIVVVIWMIPSTTLHGRSFAVYSAANSVAAYNAIVWSGLSWYSVLMYQLVEEGCCCWHCQLPWGTSQHHHHHDIYCVQWGPSSPDQYISVHRQRSASRLICSKDTVVLQHPAEYALTHYSDSSLWLRRWAGWQIKSKANVSYHSRKTTVPQPLLRHC